MQLQMALEGALQPFWLDQTMVIWTPDASSAASGR
jgi:hypothetical protein